MKHSMRNWHTWGSVALGVPLLLVGLTTFFIAHEKRLGTKEIVIPTSATVNDPVEIRASVRVGNEQWIGTKHGVFQLEGDRAAPIEGAPKDEIRDMLVVGNVALFAGKKALWRMELGKDGKATQVLKADCWQVAANGDGYAAACKDEGLLVSADGKAWQARAIEFPVQTAAMAAQAGTPLSKIIMDMHTGKLFFGKQYEWIWIDLLGMACVGLGLTGLVMWMRGRRQRAAVTG
ncbi:MAG: hypothetical protein Q7T25_02930 [Sideroxyarcus sp.]|nr:hypothetical protein [Sideroxyarcus sp.]